MAEIGRIVNSSLDIEDVFQRVGSEVGRSIPFDRLTINGINKENETVTNTYVAGIHIPELPMGQSFKLEESSTAVAIGSKAVQRIQPQNEEELAHLFPGMVTAYRAGLKSFMLVPLISQDEVVAVMRLQSCDANAYSEDNVKPEVFNTDQGSQFTGEAFTGLLEQHGVRISMDGKGRCADNILLERLWRSVKYEEVYLKAYSNGREAKVGLDAYFHFYNNQRPHQALGYRTPAEVFNGDPGSSTEPSRRRGSPTGALPIIGKTAGLSLNFAPNRSN